MRDLRHLFYFENLLQDANNDLVRQASDAGRTAVGSVCSMIPEVLLNLPGCFSVRLRAPRTGSMQMGTYYMTSMLCEYCRALLERGIEGGYQFLDCLLAPDACAQMNRCAENIDKLKLCGKDIFFVTYSDVPMKADPTALKHYAKQMRIRVLEPLRDVYGIDISDDAMKAAVGLCNEVNRLITAIGEFRKADNPRITGYEFHVLTLASYVCPQDLLIEKLSETLDELKLREPDPVQRHRARVAIIGSEIDDPDLIKLIEEAGALVVADRFCFGSLPGREPILLDDEGDILTQICSHYMGWGQCPRFMNTDKIKERHEYVDRIAKEYKADGLIYEQMKFCDYWGYERAGAGRILHEDYGYPVLSVDLPYVVGANGQLRTRVQAFVESIEIKKIQMETAK